MFYCNMYRRSKVFCELPFQTLTFKASVMNSSNLEQATVRPCVVVVQLLIGELTGNCKKKKTHHPSISMCTEIV